MLRDSVSKPKRNAKLFFAFYPAYILLFLIAENFIPEESCHMLHCALDDLVPFCEYFILPYLSWIVMVIGAGVYAYRVNLKEFRRLMCAFMFGTVVCFAVYFIYPTAQDLRPAIDPAKNLFCRIVSMTYGADTATNVCPSMHVAGALLVMFVARRLSPPKEHPVRLILTDIWCVLICISTMFVKQHSVIDVVAGVIVGIVCRLVFYGRGRISSEV